MTAFLTPSPLVAPPRRRTRAQHARPAKRTLAPARRSVLASAAGNEEGPHAAERLDDLGGRSLDAMLDTLRARRGATPIATDNLSTSSTNPSAPATRRGTVYLVGTGPGDPGLLTLRALQVMQRADVVLYDRLVTDDVLSLVSRSARLVYVGKAAGFHTRAQGEIHELLALFAGDGNGGKGVADGVSENESESDGDGENGDAAQQEYAAGRGGRIVVRLKGGDPAVFGRGGEETAYLEAAGFSVVTVPGITAASGVAAAVGVPLTLRGVSDSVRFVTGHLRDGGVEDVGAVDAHTTYVVYMGLAQLDVLAKAFVARGLDADTPAVAVERGTTPSQRVVVGTLSELSGLVATAELQSPTLVIIGAVVGVSQMWRWRGGEADVAYGFDFEDECDATRMAETDAVQRAMRLLDG